MFLYLLKRIVSVIPVMGIVALLVFLMLRLVGGDPAAIIAGDNANAAQLELVRAKLGLDKPLFTQFFIWINNLLHLDLGESYFFKKPILEMILDRAEPTFMLSLCTLFIAVLIAVPLGCLAAWKQNTWVDKSIMAFSVVGFSMPVFVIGYCLIYVFAIVNPWLPTQGYSPLAKGFLPFLERMILPSLTLSIIYIALLCRMTRASMLEVLSEDYIRTARAKGASERRVLFHHALKNAAVPIVTVIGSGFALLIGGAVVTETVFSIPGLGRLTVDAVLARDYPTIQSVILLFSFVYVLINLLVDLIYVLIDPRIKYD
jgi:peptide/nickel transport system permease protein